MTASNTSLAIELPKFTPKLYGISILMVLMLIVGTWLIQRYIQDDLTRDLSAWQEKLTLIAESRSADVTEYVSDHLSELRAVADNPSLQLYLTTLELTQKTNVSSEEPAEKSYLRNLILFTAQRMQFASIAHSTINANIEQDSIGALALVGKNSDVIVSTTMTDDVRNVLLEQSKIHTQGKEAIIPLYRSDKGQVYMGFIVPVYAIQGDRIAESQIGSVIGVKRVDESLFPLLKHPGNIDATLESVLVRAADANIEYLSPLRDGSGALTKSITNDESIDAAFLLSNPGAFVSDYPDYTGRSVLATSRHIIGTDWHLIVKVDREDALKTGNERRAGMVMFFFMLIVCVSLIIIVVWRMAHSRRADFMTRHFKKLAKQALARETLLKVVTDHQPESMYIIDSKGTYHFANLKSAQDAGTEPEFMDGKTLYDIQGAEYATRIESHANEALSHNATFYEELRSQENDDETITRYAYVPLAHIPRARLPEPTPGVLVVEHDISDVVHARERLVETQKQLVKTLVSLVDKRDPNAANHSSMVAHIAKEISSGMKLNRLTIDTINTSATLMNIGKIFVPEQLLTKTDNLTSDEKLQIQAAMKKASEVIEHVSFEGPVVETLKQSFEQMDGTGPLGLKGDRILISARVIAVANAFVSMVSLRSWREAFKVDDAQKILMEGSDTLYDRRVVIALANYLENNDGRQWLASITSKR